MIVGGKTLEILVRTCFFYLKCALVKNETPFIVLRRGFCLLVRGARSQKHLVAKFLVL